MDGRNCGEIGPGAVVFLGVRQGDTDAAACALAERTVHLRIFADADGRMNRSILESGGSVLVISQFTLYADTRKGNRPSFTEAEEPVAARGRYDAYVAALRSRLGSDRVATGAFRAVMQIDLQHDGPVSIELRTRGESENRRVG